MPEDHYSSTARVTVLAADPARGLRPAIFVVVRFDSGRPVFGASFAVNVSSVLLDAATPDSTPSAAFPGFSLTLLVPALTSPEKVAKVITVDLPLTTRLNVARKTSRPAFASRRLTTTSPPSTAACAIGAAAVAGASGGRTVTSNDAVAVLPPESVAVHVTVVVPIRSVAPDAGVQVTGSVLSI